MIDIKAVRDDPEPFKTSLARKGAAGELDALLEADRRWRELVPQVDELRAKTKLKGKPTPEQLAELQQVKPRLQEIEAQLAEAEAARDEALRQIPNPPHESAPDGTTEEDAEEVRRWGEPPAIADPKDHLELGRFDMERAARVSGSRFGYMIGDTALVALALYRFALDRLVEQGFTPVLPPVLVREEAMYGTGFFPAEKNEYYEIESDGLYLVGTSEVPLAGLHMGEILEEVPLRYTAYSSCFRREPAPRARTPAGCSASTSSRRSRCTCGSTRPSRGTSTSACSRSKRRSCRHLVSPTVS